MIRRPPTSIGLTADDLAIFEKQYASGEIYAHHHDDNDTNHKAGKKRRAQGQDGEAPGEPNEGGIQAAGDANAAEGREGDGELTQAQRAEEERKARTREQRILGSTGDVAAAAADEGGETMNTGDEGGVAGSGAQTVLQQQQQQQPQR
ncbi:hypothetical protein EPUS_03305 [Endocarpon pusillum Z07020]|uniref:Uncharacterized protein n=1 Tax=Endocarpon pusillum (strain Z07020 / HMAS-L-300199) TaxID=1263415 RepID=U1HL71_ENDPU|nr:uncharacterized protein EPUS_03305 [Endocarpon pusillum Z07020]ERF71025.1 hypothetical protein EPUS_03305 [Endocarpon pusillum Z07020]